MGKYPQEMLLFLIGVMARRFFAFKVTQRLLGYGFQLISNQGKTITGLWKPSAHGFVAYDSVGAFESKAPTP